MSNEIKFKATLDDKVSGSLAKIADNFDRLGGKGSAASLFGNVGAKAVAVGFGLIEDAAAGAVGFLGDAIKAAMQDEESQKRLGASLKANIPGFAGNTDAIEKNILSAQRLGFMDDDLRNSLALLVGATHDVAKAQEIQNVAMDLARFKGISLQDASNALIKVEGGQYRALKALGIQLPKNATATEALAAVEKVASGQAEAYANTAGGKLLAAQVRIGEAMEQFGGVILPLVVDALNGLMVVMDALGKPFRDATAMTGDWTKKQINLAEAVQLTGKSVTEINYEIQQGIDPLTGYTKAQYDAAKSFDTGSEAAASNAKALGDVGDAADTTAGALDGVKQSSEDMVRGLKADAQALIDGYYDPIITNDKLLATNADIAKNERILASKTATAAQKKDAREALHQLGKDQESYLLDLAAAGAKGASGVAKAMSSLFTRLGKAHGAERAVILDEIALLIKLRDRATTAESRIKDAAIALQYAIAHPGQPIPRATGGPVTAGNTYTVGEHGRETLVMGSSGGFVLPGTGGGSSGGSGGSVVVNMTYAPLVSSTADQQRFSQTVVPELVRELRRQSILS